MTGTYRSFGRRQFVKTAIGAAGAALASGVSLQAASSSLTKQTLRVRRDINDAVEGTATANAYRQAIARLRALPATDGRSWLLQANIHRSFCPHGNWYFLPWHRAYLLALENICASILNEPGFAIPYWNWTRDRKLPTPFVDEHVEGASNSLYSSRRMTRNDTLSTALSMDADRVFGQQVIDTILKYERFQDFGSFKPTAQDSLDPARWQLARGAKTELEREPHDFAHGAIGGLMGNPATSAQDPIFYLHHGNLDRLWARWSASGKRNETDRLWTDFKFVGNFWSVDGQNKIDVTVSELEDTTALGYRYDDIPIPPALTSPVPSPLARPQTLARSTSATSVKLLRPTEVAVGIAAEGLQLVNEIAARPARRKRLFAFIDGIQAPQNRDVLVRVFINCDYLTPQTPVDDPHFAGYFSFFVDPSHHGGEQSVAIDITQTVENLRRIDQSKEQDIVVQLLPVGYDNKVPKQTEFRVASVEIAAIES